MTRKLRLATALLAPLGLAMTLGACSSPASPPAALHREAVFVNGDFEGDAIGATPPTGWTLLNYLNATGVSGTATAPPSSFSALNLTGLGTAVNETYVVGGTTLSQYDPDLGAGQTFRFPAYGQRAARVNYRDATVNGKNRNANVLRQSMTTSLADTDPVDGQIHVRFAIAPVLENPSHSFNQQPYFYVELLNLTRGTTLFTGFNTAGQAGVPWHTTTSIVTGNTTQWLDWQLVDIAPGNAALGVGDVVQLTIVASGCELGGHFGRIYVDGFGASIPGPFVTATAAQSVNAGATLAYTINYANGGSSQAIGAQISMATPPQATFASISGISGCAVPAPGAAGTITCPLGTLAPGATGSFTVTVNVSASASGSIVDGNYSISSVGNPTLLGAKVTTAVISSSAHTADIVVVKTASATSVQPGQVFSGTPLYTITVTNNSKTDQIRASLGKSFTFTDVVPAQLTGVTWSCAVTNVGTNQQAGTTTKCRDQGGTSGYSGSGNSITLSPRLGYDGGTGGGQITIQVFGTVSASATGTMVNTAAASAPSGITDPNLANNTSTVSLPVGTPRTLTLNKTGTAYGTVTSAPAGISCGTSCSTTSATFSSGTQVILVASPVAGASFTGWGGAVPASCTGTPAPTSCALTLSAAATVTATFAAPPAPAAPAAIYPYSGSGQLTRTSTAFASPVAALVVDANGTPVSGVTVTFTAVPSAGGASAGLGGGTAVTSAAGVAQLTATANATPGTYAVAAAVGGVASPAVFTLTNVGPPASITYLAGGSTTDPQVTPVGTAFAAALVAIVRDAAGNPVPGATVSYAAVPVAGASATLTSGGSSGANVSAVTDSAGMTSVAATANSTVGAYTATATVGGVATPATFYLQNVTTGPAAVYVVSGSPQVAPINSAFGSPLVVVVSDSAGNSLPGVTVAFTAQAAASGATATLSAASAVTDGTGLAGVTATANGSGGIYTVTASVSGATPAIFSLTNDGGYTIQVQAGSPQATTVGTAFPSSLQALVLDGTGAPASGLAVTFQAPAAGATATLGGGSACVPAATGCMTAVTNGSGIAAVTATANGVSGSYAVAAATPNAPTPATFSLANQCTASSQCGGIAPICDGTSHTCVACSGDATCSAKSSATPYCDVSGACVACESDAQCAGTTPICSQATDACAACTTDAQCGDKDATTPYCLATGACFAGYAIVPSASAGGAIDPAFVQTVGPGASVGFTFTPSTGHHVAGVLVDGTSVGTPAGYTFTAVQASHTIAVTFAIDTFTVTGSAGAHGSITPAGDQTVSYGGSVSFSIAPDTGYHVADVSVDGASVGPVTSYAFTNVTAAHTVAATFAADVYAITASSSGSGTVACPATVAYGDSATCTLSPGPGWILVALTDDLADVFAQVAAGSYVIANASGPHDLVATFSKGLGTACGAGGECGSGLCVDGVCCNATCGGQCEACNAPGFAGLCTPVSGAPVGLRPACASDGSVCGGACNGTNALSCAYPGAGASCRSASCAGQTATLVAACDGAGACPAVQTQACAPYVCGPSACLSSCTDDPQCVGGDYCNAGACQPKKAAGQACSGANQCASGSCVDGVCCDTACDGQCEACNLAGKVGTCSPVTGAPAGGRAACTSDGSACGGACDGSSRSSCAYPGAATSCRAASCADGTATLAAACAGTGTCPPVQTQACNPYVCGASACLSSCTTDGQCASGSWCSGGSCVPQLAGGDACQGSGQCLSGNCVDGVCCDTACDGQCEACNVPGSAGTCAAVTGAPVAPRAACATDGSVCGGACDGTRRNVCAYPADATSCRDPSCADGTATLAAACDGAGHCPPVQTQACGAYACGATACAGSCSSSSDCAAGQWCSGGVCTAQLSPGAVCGADVQCASGHCADGVCCDTACDGQCEACNLSGSVGTCSPSSGAPVGARPACTSDGSACGGACDGTSRAACAYPQSGVSCRAASCGDGVATLGASCDGTGRCPAVQTQPCAPNLCGATACAGGCAGDGDCVTGYWCSAGVCTAAADDGATCSGGSQCASGHCVDGVCCDGACNGQCEACNLPGSAGTCSAVTGAPVNGRTQCTSDGSVCGGACDGSNRQACAFPDQGVGCRAASCAGGVATLAAACDGAGSCPSPQQQTCAPGVCGASACAGGCTSDLGCVAGYWCAAGVCTPTLGNGAACSGASQCGSGQCVDGVCCDVACDGQCEACDVAGHAGTCTPVAGAPHGGARAACASDGSACGGACDGSNRAACAFPGTGATCRAATCAAGAATAAATCDGAGTCGASPAPVSCGPYACAGDGCATSCTTSAECAAGAACEAGACVASGAAGTTAGWRVAGSGGCSAAGGGTLSSLALLLLALRLGAARRRRAAPPAVVALALALALPAPARAQSTSFDAQRFQPLGGAFDLLAVPSARVPGHLEGRAGAFLDFAEEPLRLTGGSGPPVSLVGSQTDLTLTGSIGLLDRFEVSVAAPLVIQSSGEPASQASPGLPSRRPGSGLGDLRVTPRAQLVEVGPLRLAAALPVTLPTATSAFAGQAGPSASPLAVAEWSTAGGWRVVGDVGVTLRRRQTLVNLDQGTAFTFGAGGEVPFRIAGARVAGIVTVGGEVGAGAVERPVELLAALRWAAPGGVDVTVGGGHGLSEGYGMPRYRLLFGVDLARVALRRARPAPPPEEAPAEAPAAATPPAAAPVAVPAPVPAPEEAPPPPPREEPPPADPCAGGTASAGSGCPAPKAVLTARKIDLREAVFFDNGKDLIQERSFQLLDEVGRILADHPEVKRVSIEGHTDSLGNASANQRLSLRRAAAVKAYLVSKGVDPTRLEDRGFGSARPVAGNDTPDGRARNRRVEFVVAP